MANGVQLSKHVLDNNVLSNLENEQKIIDRAPFVKLKIKDAGVLDSIEGREICGNCYKSRKFFCYTCCTPVIDKQYIPRVKLPIQIDIIKHAREIDGKSTAIHAAVIAPEGVRIYTYPEFPEISKDDKVVLIFPSKTATSIEDLFVRKVDRGGQIIEEKIKNEFPITRAIFIDSTWHQTKSIYKDQRLRSRYTHFVHITVLFADSCCGQFYKIFFPILIMYKFGKCTDNHSFNEGIRPMRTYLRMNHMILSAQARLFSNHSTNARRPAVCCPEISDFTILEASEIKSQVVPGNYRSDPSIFGRITHERIRCGTKLCYSVSWQNRIHRRKGRRGFLGR